MGKQQAASVVVKNEGGKILLVQRGDAPYRGRWSLPGGSVEEGETAAQAAVREAYEETGYRVRAEEALPVTTMPGVPTRGSGFEIHPFRAVVIGGELAAGDDAPNAGWFSTEELVGVDLTPGLASYLQVAAILTPKQAGPLRVRGALTDAGISAPIRHYGRASSIREAAQMRGVPDSAMIKTLVVRKREGQYLFVLVPGDRQISWPKLRALLGVNRMSLPNAEQAFAVTGFERGTITPFGSLHPWPVIADERMCGAVVFGAGGHGLSVTVPVEEAIEVLGAQVADVTEPL